MQPPDSFPNIMFDICKGIHDEQKRTMDVSKMGAIDIACRDHSYLFAIATFQKQVSHAMHINYHSVCALKSVCADTLSGLDKICMEISSWNCLDINLFSNQHTFVWSRSA